MAKRRINIDERLFPQVPLKYKDIPVANEDGTCLERCRKCQGAGSLATAMRTVEEFNKAPRTDKYGVSPTDKKSWERKGYAVTIDTCNCCNGAGLIARVRN